MDWKSKQISLPRNTKDITKSVGHRDRGFVADEPHYMLVRSDDENSRNLGILDQYRSYLFLVLLFDFFFCFVLQFKYLK